MRSARKALIVAASGGVIFALSWRGPAEDVDAPQLGGECGLQYFEVSGPFPEVVLLRNLAKGLVAREVVAGKWTLWEAAALYGSLDRLPPAMGIPLGLDDPKVAIPMRTEDERLCWQVARRVLGLRGLSDEQAKAAVARLVAEFDAEMAQGPISLPDPAALESAESLIERARP
jgi:hypothetical protein